ncbi:alanine--tRNA ligase [Acidithrix ferrooxidans]|uniref:Alanine--tRNA ligase n=2 Tax=Acidithrix ferrooxidans TaxID=1280514 RepID=A0A0D8HLB8_9ACTN|nr:alanine--tRNA ligase [Acidithrix ferrooxidans]
MSRADKICIQMEANELRKAFTDFFVERGHTLVPSASLIPHDPTVLFTVAGMVPFKPYFLGEEQPAFSRATSIQKCMRAGGKHNDLDQIGRTARHLTFFEMLGNFSFGDYFKNEAIPYAWQLVTEVLGLDPNRLWVTVHLSDDEAEAIWRDKVGVNPKRIQRLDEDNWWQMADTGPCGPCSEIYYDKGESYGADGGPAFGSDERFLEIWNLVFMQYDRAEDGSLHLLPKPCIDTGAGLERILPVIQGKGSVYETDLLWPILAAGAALIGATYGQDPEVDVSLRIMADHARSMAFLVADGVIPSNEGRGYVLRRIIRRAALRAWRIKDVESVMITLLDAVIDNLGVAYPELVTGADFIKSVIDREEKSFAKTLRAGSNLLDAELERGLPISGEAAFRLHDTYGFPIELTQEIAMDRGVEVDTAGFEVEMDKQRTRARADRKEKGGDNELNDRYREIFESFGPTIFSGYSTLGDQGRIVGIFKSEGQDDLYEVFLDRTSFYGEQGGQVGDTGVISTEGVVGEVLDTNFAFSSLTRHIVRIPSGEFRIGQNVSMSVDRARRNAIRKNHTATHLVHSALRSVLGDHVKQQGSLVAPDRLRFDFFHWGPLLPDEIIKVEELVNEAISASEKVETKVTSKSEAMEMGAIAFFGDKYGDSVRVVRAGSTSMEFCGGTHVDELGAIGLFVITQETSIGANTRRIEALTGLGALSYLKAKAALLGQVTSVLGTSETEVLSRLEQMRIKERELTSTLAGYERERLSKLTKDLFSRIDDGILIERLDGQNPNALKEISSILKSHVGLKFVALISLFDENKVALVATRGPDSSIDVSSAVAGAAKVLGGGVGRNADFAQTGGKNYEKIDEALQIIKKSI